MSIDRLGPNVTSLPQRPSGTAATRDANIRSRQPLDIAQTKTAQPTRPSLTAPAANELPAEPPAGTDPELWAVLSSSERSFFAKVGAMGPLTYGRVISEPTSTPPAGVRGGRLDIRG